MATAATVCCASTSSAFRTNVVCSMAPARMPSDTTAASITSLRVRGYTMPSERPPTWWLARPMRCSPLATEGGGATCSTRSTAPMSMPSSRLDVATTHGSCPLLSSCSTCRRRSFETEPWCALAMTSKAPCTKSLVAPMSERMPVGVEAPETSGPPGRASCPPAATPPSGPPGRSPRRFAYSSFSRAVSFSHRPREFTNTMVERCASTWSSTAASMSGQMEDEPARLSGDPAAGFADPPAMSVFKARSDFHASSCGARRGPPAPPLCAAGPAMSASAPPYAGMAVMSRTGTTTRTSRSGRPSSATTRTGRTPPRKRATSSRGRTVAESPMRCAGRSSRPSRRSRLSARCAPRLLPASACTSSTMTTSTVRRMSRAFDVSMRYSDSGVVMRMSGGLRRSARRSSGVVSPVRMPVRTGGAPPPCAASLSATPASGSCRLRSTSAPSALSGDTYSTRTPFARGRPSTKPGPSGSSGSPRSSAPSFARGRPPAAAFSCMSSSMANRNAARVLPEPVGATTSTFSPCPMASQARRCTGVGPAANAARNHARTTGENRPNPAAADRSFASSMAVLASFP